jgi:hypothetical protein
VEYPEGTSHLHHGGLQSLVGNPVSRDGSKPRPSARILRKLERDHGSACKKDSPRERTLREDWLMVDGNWRHTGVEEIPCEL